MGHRGKRWVCQMLGFKKRQKSHRDAKRYDGTERLLLFRSWDIQLNQCSGNGEPLLSLDCSPQRQTLVTGSELYKSQASVALWSASDPSSLLGFWLRVADVCFRDVRNPTQPQLQYVESHNDDITEVGHVPQLLDRHL